MKFLKVGRVAIITRGRYAGKKVRSIDGCVKPGFRMHAPHYEGTKGGRTLGIETRNDISDARRGGLSRESDESMSSIGF